MRKQSVFYDVKELISGQSAEGKPPDEMDKMLAVVNNEYKRVCKENLALRHRIESLKDSMRHNRDFVDTEIPDVSEELAAVQVCVPTIMIGESSPLALTLNDPPDEPSKEDSSHFVSEDPSTSERAKMKFQVSRPRHAVAMASSHASLDHLGMVAKGASKKTTGDVAKSTQWPSSIKPRFEPEPSTGGPPTAGINIQSSRPFDSSLRASFRQQFHPALTSATILDRRSCRVVLHPNSSATMILDMLGIAVLCLDIILTPYVLAWNLPMTNELFVLSCCTTGYWLLDFIVCFHTGVYVGGQLSMNRRVIAKTYLRGSCCIDALLLACDGFALALSGNDEHKELVRITKAFRCLKILRISRLFRFVGRAMIFCLSFRVRFAIQMGTMVFLTCLFNHVLSCMWYAVGKYVTGDTEVSWVDGMVGEYPDLPLYQYLTALHWVVAQMTLGSTDVGPQNSFERIFAVLLLFVAMIFGSTLISFISAQIVRLIMMQTDRQAELSSLRLYLRQEHITGPLAADVQRQISERLEAPTMLVQENVTALASLSKSLREKLDNAVKFPRVFSYPLFRTWGQMDVRAVRDLCNCAVDFECFLPEDDLFVPGELAISSYKLIDGAMQYTQFPKSSKVDSLTTTDVTTGAWVAEAAMWVWWKHVGQATATTAVKVLTVDSAELYEVIMRNTHIRNVSLTFAENYHQRVIVAMPPHLSWPSDLHVPFTDATDLMSMHHEAQLLHLAMEHGSINISNDQYELLMNELSKDLCSLSSTDDGKLLRVVNIVALMLRDNTGDRLFAQIGKWENEVMHVSCGLPGKKRQRKELPHDTVRRFLGEDLPPLKDAVWLGDTSHEVSTSKSERYGLDTTYLRLIFEASILVDSDVSFQVATFDDPKTVRATVGEIAPAELTVYQCPNQKGWAYFAWLTDAEFEHYRSTIVGKAALQALLDGISITVSTFV